MDSASVPVLNAPMRSLAMTPLDEEEEGLAADAAVTLVRTKSAHNLGGPFGAGGGGVASAGSVESVSATRVAELEVVSEVLLSGTDFGDTSFEGSSDCGATDGLRTCGKATLGTIGTTGLVGVLV